MQYTHNASHRARRQWQLGQTHANKGAWDAAAKAFAVATRLAPNDSVYALNLARAHMRMGDMRKAGDEAERAFHMDTHNAVACALWVHCLVQQKRHRDAAIALRMLHPDAPRDHDYHETMGRALQYSGQIREAISAYFDALAVKLDLSPVHYQLGVCFNDLDMKEEATECFKTALALGIGRHELGVRGLLSYFEREVCRWDAAAPQLQLLLEALRALPDDAAVPTTPFAHVTLFDDPMDQLKAARSASREAAANTKALPALGPRTTTRRMRVGYVSNDFHQHATMILMAEMLEQHDRERFEVWLYSHGKSDNSAMRRRVENACEHFVDVHALREEELARRIRDDDIDLLIDLKGHTRDNKLSMFAWRAARVQASFLGFPGSAGADAIDYIVGDTVVTPLAHAAHFSEKIAQMPVCYQPNDRQRARPAPTAREQLGLPQDAVVLCGFNQPFKISAEVFDVWCRVLDRCPDTVLWLLEWNQQVRKNIEFEAARRGIDVSRIVWAAKAQPAAHMARLQQADLFIDTWPCNAHTTASDALWACVPVVTFMGNTFASRVAGSLNRAAGMDDLTCASAADYEERIVQLAGDAPARQALRERLAANRDDCVLFDSRRFTLDIEALYVRMVERHDNGLAPDHLPAASAGH
ncbi:MAG: putative O-linked N-acetylglucosamine transferase, family [Rhizobacter sp.]|jgi:predicted O-linked N-acetylglucosamine transferase (SPINDLY family)|nr:putative O-linked N-acetylglucosamine transferase, family [Rhizobacter sp.]